MDIFNNNGVAVTGWIVAGVLMIAGAAGYLYYSTKLHDLQQLNTALKYASEQNLKTIQKLTDAQTNTDKVLLAREKEIEQLKNQTQTIKTEIKEIYGKDTQAKNWADTEIPQAIILRLQNNPTGADNTGADGMRQNRNSD